MRRIQASALTVALVLAASFARADDQEAARAAMRRGAAALESGDAETALAEYETAKRLAPMANAPWFFAAEALSRLERWRDVVENLETYLAKNPEVSDAAEVRSRIATIRAKHFPARVRIETGVNDSTVLVDDVPSGRAGEYLELAPGIHRVEARAPAHDPARIEIEVAGDTERTVKLALTPLPARVEPERPAPAPATPAAPRGNSSWHTLGWVTAGVGAAGLTAAFLSDVLVLGPKIDDYQRAADRHDPDARGLHSDAEGIRTGVLVGYVAGGTLALAVSPSSCSRRVRPRSPWCRRSGRRWAASPRTSGSSEPAQPKYAFTEPSVSVRKDFAFIQVLTAVYAIDPRIARSQLRMKVNVMRPMPTTPRTVTTAEKRMSSVRTSDDFFRSARPMKNVSVQLTSKPKSAPPTEKNPIPFVRIEQTAEKTAKPYQEFVSPSIFALPPIMRPRSSSFVLAAVSYARATRCVPSCRSASTADPACAFQSPRASLSYALGDISIFEPIPS